MKKVNFTNESFIFELSSLTGEKYGSICNGAYTIGRHCIIGPKNPEIGKKIMEDGLKIASGSSLYTVTPLGRIDRNEVYSLFNQNIEWIPKDSWSSGVVVAIPSMFKTSDDRCIYLGDITHNQKSEKYNPSSIMDRFLEHMHLVDPNFILGYFEKGENNSIDFIFNENFIAFKDKEYQDKFIDAVLTIIKDELGLPLINAKMSSEELEILKEKFYSANIPESLNYILKTLLQLENDKKNISVNIK